MAEIFPILTGLASGALLALLAPRTRIVVAATLSVVLGVTATVISGEYLIGWEFLLVDIPLVAVSSVAGLSTVRALQRRGSRIASG